MPPRGQKPSASAPTMGPPPPRSSARTTRSASKDLDEAVSTARTSKRGASDNDGAAAGQSKRARVTQTKKAELTPVAEDDDEELENEEAAAILNQLATGKPATPSVKGKAKVGNSPQSNQQQSERGSAQMSSRRKPRSSLPSEPTGSSYYHASDKNETHETVDEDVLADLVVSTQQKNNKENHLPAATSAGRLKRPRKFIEKQSGAQRVSQISDDQEQEASDQEILQVEGAEPSSSGSESEIPAKASTPKKAGRGKAGPKEVVKISRADKRRQAPSRTVRAMPQAKMTADPVEEDEDEEQLETQDAATLARARFNARMKAEAASPAPSTPSRLGSLAPIDPSAPTPSYREIQKRAKERSAMLRKAPPQKRRFWVEEEEQELIRLIEERGCAWAEFEKEGAFNRWGGRNQGQLKDKAMNIRFDLEKSGYPVTGNFLNISLRKSMREELERLGRQMEEAEVFNSAEADEDEA